MQALDAALGSDIDISNSPSNPSAVNIVREAAANTIKGAAESFVPFRSWLRKLTGADRYSKDISLAIASGTIRRAYLKGLSQGHGCQAPAAPVN
ncbi:MAG: hypothetical protein HY306_02790 [Nitrosomonadales bacterium]|nr:hypothetical protein [Nitrosomonadales bacterium]